MCLLVRFITQICSLKPIYTHLKNQHLASNFSHWSALSDDFWSWHSQLLLDGKCKNQWIDPKCNMTSVPKLPLKGTCSLSNKLILAQCLKIRLYKNIALWCNVSSFFLWFQPWTCMHSIQENSHHWQRESWSKHIHSPVKIREMTNHVCHCCKKQWVSLFVFLLLGVKLF